ncbi:MAG: type II secretion system F family protein [Gammaproteobacteria bacterium]
MSALHLSAVFLLLASILLIVAAIRRNALDRALIQRMGGRDNSKLQLKRHQNQEYLKWSIDSEIGCLLNKLGWRRHGLRNFFMLCQLGTPIALVLSVWLFNLLSGNEMTLLSGLAAGGVGILLPKRALAIAASRRQRRIAIDVSTILPMMRMFFEVGMTVEQALRVLAGEGDKIAPDVVQELKIALSRVDAGLDLGVELQAMAKLVDVDELTECVGILEQLLRQGGGALASLRNLKTLLDERRVTNLQESVSKMSAKVSGVMVLFLLPALLIVLAGPGFIAILESLGGT